MQLMRWSITRRLENRGLRQRRDSRICQPDGIDGIDGHHFSHCSGEENDSASDGEESGGGGRGRGGGGGGGGERKEGERGEGGAVCDEAVDLTAARSHHDEEEDRDPEEMPMEEEEEEGIDEQEEQEDDEEGSRKRMHHRQDAENNNSFVEGAPIAGIFPPAGTSHVTLEALQNTNVAVAQFAPPALAANPDSEAVLQELALLYTIQKQHQVFQLQLINQIQQKLSINQGGQSVQQPGEANASDSKEASPSSPVIHPKSLSSLTSPPLATSRSPSRHGQPSPMIALASTVAQHAAAAAAATAAAAAAERPVPSASASPLSVPLSCTASTTTSATATTSSSSVQIAALSHQMPLCSISASLASTIITNNDPLPLHEPNTLEMLQKRAQEVLDNASQGLLANNLADELAFRGSKGSRLSPYDSKSGGARGEPFFKHRCRYCGKVFGSDSALQIHIRSHTGERPFKCNVCGSRFTTKGNLKVHFQRHTAKFPHVKMNPNPIPEHLDKFHPPLLQQLAASGQRPLLSPPPPPSQQPSHSQFHSTVTTTTATTTTTTHGFLPQQPMPLSLAIPGMPPLYRSSLVNHRDDQDVPENLSKPVTSAPTSSPNSPNALPNSHHSFHHDSRQESHHLHQQQHLHHHHHHHQQQLQQKSRDDIKVERQSPLQEQYQQRPTSRETSERISPKREPVEDADDNTEDESKEFDAARRYLNSSPSSLVNAASHTQPYEDCSMDSKMSGGRLEADGDMDADGGEMEEEQPENLSSRPSSNRLSQQAIGFIRGASPASSNASNSSLQTTFAGILFPGPTPHQIPHHHSSTSVSTSTAGNMGDMMMDPARDPAIYSSLLPRPGSNDNSWESLIEITKTSETSKLQQLVDNIEHKLTDPNQCVICHRVLSCKSALQMHYRTHTGERPFKCKICGRAFTTKGNLKTHMGVHRAKPPLRVLHQCPVCHKKFTNAIVLQQHIRLHTGEPTDLSPEQIQAAEVNEFPPGYPHHLTPFLPQGFPPLHPAGPGFNVSLTFPPRSHILDRHTLDNDMDALESQHHQHDQERYLDEHCEEDTEDQEDEEKDSREDDERCEVGRERRGSLLDEDEEKTEQDIEDAECKDVVPTFSTSLAALENQVRTITTMASSLGSLARSPPIHRYNGGSEKSSSPPSNGTPLDLTPRASSTPASAASTPTPPPPPSQATSHHPHPFGMFAGLLQAASSSPSTNHMGSVNSVSSINAVSPGSGGVGPLASLTTSAVLAATSTYNPLGLAVGGPAVRGNTTCNICYKTFACNSALEIHYRSHTKERPFKCTICDRGFSTKNDGTWADTCNCSKQRNGFHDSSPIKPDFQYQPLLTIPKPSETKEKPKRRRRRPEDRKSRGRTRPEGGRGQTSSNAAIYEDVRLPPLMPSALGLLTSDPVFLGNMKQHMLTHKIRDMPSHLFSDMKSSSQQSPVQQHQPAIPPPPPPPSQEHETSTSPMRSEESSGGSNLPPPPPPPPPPPLPPPPPPPMPSMPPSSLESSMPVKRSAPEGELPAPKRPPSMSSKHLCQVCNKNFSSSSALQIHMRTHTGDKPFRCTVCQKAFTTKGNLKVHMGTHMWTNGASRRGRRMSLDLPPLPITPKDSEFLQRRPDLFYPYLPAPFLNGVQQKLNEISVIQSSNGLPAHSANKYAAGIFGAVYGNAGFPLEKQPMAPSNDGKSTLPAGSMLFQANPSPSHSPSNTGNQSSASLPSWSTEALQHRHFDREPPPTRTESNTTPPTAAAAASAHLPPPPPAPRGEGLAA